MNHLSALIAQEETASGSAAFQFVLLAAVPLALYFLMIRPQRRKMREAAEMQASLAVGDEVITGSGIYGFITAVEDDLFWIEVDEDVQLRVVKSQVHGRVSGQAASPADDDDQGEPDES
ncbi:preprotein translocase subunit YajC [Actinomycetota bacterium]|nr:preprotein translocase subunit YajC [Actinomycetota bacterium]